MCSRVDLPGYGIEDLKRWIRISFRARHSNSGAWHRQYIRQCIREIRELQ